MNYSNHLNHETFEEPVFFRITSVEGKAILPSYDIEKTIFIEIHELDRSSFDIALFVNEAKAEFVFESAEVDTDKVIEDVIEMIQNFNQPPEKFSEDKKEEYRGYDVEVDDVYRS